MSTTNVNESLGTFFLQHPIFSRAEISEFLASRGTTNRGTQTALMAYHAKRGRIVQIRRGLYASVPPGENQASLLVDPFLLACKLADDAALAYHTALSFHGKAYSVRSDITFLTSRGNGLHFRYQRVTYRPVSHPGALQDIGKQELGVMTTAREAGAVRVTTLERTMVDVLDRPHLGGGWEEIWRSLEAIEYFDLEAVMDYTRLLGNATTTAKVGFFLEQHREALMVEDRHLAQLRQYRPVRAHYLDRAKRESGQLVPGWNLVVPRRVLDRAWEEQL